MDLSVPEAADSLKIAPGSLRNIESGQPRAVVSLRLAHRAARFYGVPFEKLVATTTEGSEPQKKDPQGEPVAPPKRQDKKAPKRARSAA